MNAGFVLIMEYSAILLRMDIIHELEKREEQVLGVAFSLGMWWRILYGTLRLILGGILLKFFIGTHLADVLLNAMSYEVETDPNDAIFQFIYVALQDHTFTITYFVASYLIFWGTVDIVLSICLLQRRLWAFPLTMGLISLFILYSIYRVFHTHSLILLSIILIDIVIVYIIYHEYTNLKVTVAEHERIAPTT